MSVLFDDSTLPNATRIKHCVFAIASMLQHLTDLAKEEDEDDSIRNAINKFQAGVGMVAVSAVFTKTTGCSLLQWRNKKGR